MVITFYHFLTGKTDKGPRNEIFYFADTGELTALRYQDWKMIFMEQERPDTLTRLDRALDAITGTSYFQSTPRSL